MDLLPSLEAARRAIADDDLAALRLLIERCPALLDWQDDKSEDVLLSATTSYANFPGAENEATWNRIRAAELLLDAGARVSPTVVERILDTGAHQMLRSFHARDALPKNLRVAAARGDLPTIEACFDSAGKLTDAGRPEPALANRSMWPDARDESAILTDAALYACRFEHREVVDALLPRYIEQVPDFAARLQSVGGAEAWTQCMLTRVPDGARSDLGSRSPSADPLWRGHLELALHHSLRAGEAGQIQTLLTEEPLLRTRDAHVILTRLLEVAAFTPDALPVLAAVTHSENPALAYLNQTSPAVHYALEYGNADYLTYLRRWFPTPETLPHAAGRGDLDQVQAFYLGDRWHLDPLSRHVPFPDQEPAPTEQSVLDRALAWAVRNDEFEVADFMLAHGADVSTRWSSHEPASLLHECAAAGSLAQVRFLVDRGVDLTITDSRFGATAAEWAEHGGHQEIAALLER